MERQFFEENNIFEVKQLKVRFEGMRRRSKIIVGVFVAVLIALVGFLVWAETPLGPMSEDYTTIIGLAAAALGGFSLFPQLLKILKTKSTKDLSLGMIMLFCTSIFLWLVYGILMKNSPIIIANFFGFLEALIILLFKIKYH
jgi:MtN3 and saliva related transmembrane protein